MRKVIHGGTIYDGLGNPPIKADLLIEGEKITGIGNDLSKKGAEVIGATNKVVTPGFVNLHRHSDVAPFTDPQFGDIKLAQGITTI